MELGVIRRVYHAGANARFDGKVRRHHQLICTSCQAIFDFDDENVDQLPLPKRKLRGFEVDDFSVQFSGVCPDCQKKKN